VRAFHQHGAVGGPQDDDGVHLERGDTWDEIPREIQECIEAGIHIIRRLRASIRAAARVRCMPPVVIDPAVWQPRGSTIVVHGASQLCPDTNGGVTMVTLLGAGVALCRDEDLVRAVLVHEFAHCFQTATVVINHLDHGEGLRALAGESLDPAREHRSLANPADWFGDSDQELLRWGDERMASLTDGVRSLVLGRRLPLTEPPLTLRGTWIVPPEWAEHIRTLRRS